MNFFRKLSKTTPAGFFWVDFPQPSFWSPWFPFRKNLTVKVCLQNSPKHHFLKGKTVPFRGDLVDSPPFWFYFLDIQDFLTNKKNVIQNGLRFPGNLLG